MEDRLFPQESGEQPTGRRLPVYMLLDTSASMMQGDAIGAVQRGVEQFKRVLLDVPEAVQSVHLKVISFNSTVSETPMTPLLSFQPPMLTASGTTALGAALRQLNDDAQFGHDLVRNSAQQKGDWLPIVFILTDGEPTDPSSEFSSAADTILQRTRRQEMNVFAIACGADASPPALHQITDRVIGMGTLSDGQIRELFVWMSQSIAARSRAVSRPQAGGAPGPTEMPPLPSGLYMV